VEPGALAGNELTNNKAPIQGRFWGFVRLIMFVGQILRPFGCAPAFAKVPKAQASAGKQDAA